MKLITVLSSLLLTGVANSRQLESKPFHLVIHSSNEQFDGKKLFPCHTGAAIESLCVSGDIGARYFFNTTKGSGSPLKGYEPSGRLIWDLPLDPGFVSEPMSFYTDPSTNVALLLFEPGYTTQYVTFDKNNGQLALFSYLNDRVIPPTENKVQVLKNWYVCRTNFSGYQYRTLNWVMGDSRAKPQNPSCVKVEVQRKFIKYVSV